MKVAIILSVFLTTFSALANVNCDIYLVMSEVDGRHDLTEKVLTKFESSGYRISRIEKPSDIEDQGKISYMSVFSDIHPLIGAKTTINLVDFYIEEGSITSRTQSKIELSKNPFFGSAERALLRSVGKSIPSCVE